MIVCSFSQSLLQSHEKVEGEIRSYSTEVDRLKELSKKVIEGATVAPSFVSTQNFELKVDRTSIVCIVAYLTCKS